MSTRIAATLACLAATLCLAPARPAAAQTEARNDRPNIIFIFSDDHAYQAIGAYNSRLKDVVRTPNIDKLASQGMRFDYCYVTNSLCGPMRAVIQTGKYSHLNGYLDNKGTSHFDNSQQTFPKLLQKAGYQTAIIGKWHLGAKVAPQGYNYSEVLIGQGRYYNPTMLKDAKGSGDDAQRTRETHHGYVTDIITDLSLDWLEHGRDKSKPFMLMCQHKAPHREWSPKPRVYEHWKGVEIPEPPTLFEDYDTEVEPRQHQQMTIARHFHTGQDDKRRNYVPDGLDSQQKTAYRAMFSKENEEFEKILPTLTEKQRVHWIYERYLRTYLACVESVDDSVGRLLDYLKKTGLDKNTIVIYSSDQGFYLGEHGWYDKRWVYNQSLKTPLIARWPGHVKPGSVNADIVSPLDFAETFLDIAGAKVPDDMQGRSLVPVLEGRTPDDWRSSFYYHYYEYPGYHEVNRHYAVCTRRFKLIHFYKPAPELGVDAWELVDLEKDPLEQHNYYNDPEYADVRKKLHAELMRLREQYKVPPTDPPALNVGRNVH